MAAIEKYIKAAETGENSPTAFVNYAVAKKVEGKYKLNRILMILGYILVDALFLFAILVATKMPMLGAFIPLLTWVMVYFTWMYVSVEYEYTITGGVLKAMEVYGLRKCKTLCTVRVSSMKRIAPYSGEYKSEADSSGAKPVSCVSSMDSPDVYFALFKDESGEDKILFFEATEKTLKVIKYYNPEVIITKTRY